MAVFLPDALYPGSSGNISSLESTAVATSVRKRLTNTVEQRGRDYLDGDDRHNLWF